MRFRPTLPFATFQNALDEGFRFLGFTGVAAAGACTLAGAKVGDKVIGVVSITDGGSAAASFEGEITVDDEIQQTSASNLSTKNFVVLLVAKP